MNGCRISAYSTPQVGALDKKTYVNDPAYVEPMVARLMNRWTYPLRLWVVVQSKVDVQVIFDLHAYVGDIVYGYMRTTILRERRGDAVKVKLCLISLGWC